MKAEAEKRQVNKSIVRTKKYRNENKIGSFILIFMLSVPLAIAQSCR